MSTELGPISTTCAAMSTKGLIPFLQPSASPQDRHPRRPDHLAVFRRTSRRARARLRTHVHQRAEDHAIGGATLNLHVGEPALRLLHIPDLGGPKLGGSPQIQVALLE